MHGDVAIHPGVVLVRELRPWSQKVSKKPAAMIARILTLLVSRDQPIILLPTQN